MHRYAHPIYLSHISIPYIYTHISIPYVSHMCPKSTHIYLSHICPNIDICIDICYCWQQEWSRYHGCSRRVGPRAPCSCALVRAVRLGPCQRRGREVGRRSRSPPARARGTYRPLGLSQTTPVCLCASKHPAACRTGLQEPLRRLWHGNPHSPSSSGIEHGPRTRQDARAAAPVDG